MKIVFLALLECKVLFTFGQCKMQLVDWQIIGAAKAVPAAPLTTPLYVYPMFSVYTSPFVYIYIMFSVYASYSVYVYLMFSVYTSHSECSLCIPRSLYTYT